MSTIESVELRLADEKIEELESEIDDYREFVKSVDRALTPPKNEKEKQNIRNELHNLRTMCDYLMNRYMSDDG